MDLTIEEFKKVQIKIGKILSAEKVENSEKLLKLSVDFGEESPRQVISGIQTYFPEPNDLVGKKCSFVTNLVPRSIMGLESQAMILAVSGDGYFSLLSPTIDTPPGATAK